MLWCLQMVGVCVEGLDNLAQFGDDALQDDVATQLEASGALELLLERPGMEPQRVLWAPRSPLCFRPGCIAVHV